MIFIFIIAKYTNHSVTLYEFDCEQEAVELYDKIDGTKIFTTIIDSAALSLKNQTTQAIFKETTKIAASSN